MRSIWLFVLIVVLKLINSQELTTIESVKDVEEKIYKSKYNSILLVYDSDLMQEQQQNEGKQLELLLNVFSSANDNNDALGKPFDNYFIFDIAKQVTKGKEGLSKKQLDRNRKQILSDLNVPILPDVRVFTEQGRLNAYTNKFWRPSNQLVINQNAPTNSKSVVKKTLKFLDKTKVKVLESDDEFHFRQTLNLLLFTEKSKVTSLMHSLGMVLDSQYGINTTQLVQFEKDINLKTKYGIESLPSIGFLDADGNFTLLETESIVKLGVNGIIENLIVPNLPKDFNNEEKKEEATKEDKQEDIMGVIDNTKDYTNLILLQAMPSLVSYYNLEGATTNDQVPFDTIPKWNKFHQSMIDLGFNSYIIYCTKANYKKLNCPKSIFKGKNKFKFRVFLYDERSLEDKKEDADEKRFLDVDDLKEGKQEALVSLPNLVKNLLGDQDNSQFVSQTLHVEKQIPVLLLGKPNKNEIPSLLLTSAVGLRGLVKFAYCSNCGVDEMKKSGILEGDTKLPILLSFAQDPDEDAKNPEPRVMIAKYDRMAYGKYSYQTIMAWVLGLASQTNKELYEEFTRNFKNNMVMTEDDSKNKKSNAGKSSQSKNNEDQNTPVLEIDSLETWDESCGKDIKMSNVMCILLFIDGLSTDLENYKNILFQAKKASYELNLQASTNYKFHFVDSINCQNKLATDYFKVSQDNLPLLLAYHPAKKYKAIMKGSMTENNVIDWLKQISNGSGFVNVGSKKDSNDFIETKKICKDEREKILKLIEDNKREEL